METINTRALMSIGLLMAVTINSTNSYAHGTANYSLEGRQVSVHGSHSATKDQTTWGVAGDSKQVSRVLRIEMNDQMRFVPDAITIKKGETIRFEIRNAGKTIHEMVIGTRQELDAHAEMMKKYPNMEHDEAYMAHVDAGKTADIVWLFNREGNFEFACLIPGHYQAGMRGKIRVTL